MKTGAYTGRLAYDPETEFHTDEDGDPVVTDDGGLSWHYAAEDDPSHFARYHERFAQIDGTANRLAELQLEHGREQAEELMRQEQPHHFAPQPDDPHADGIRVDRDRIAATITSHTEAYKEESA